MYTFEDLKQIMKTLRAEDGCPWDRAQDHETLKKHLVEECAEVLEAIDSGDTENLCEELGDVLFQVMFHSEIEAEFRRSRMRKISGKRSKNRNGK